MAVVYFISECSPSAMDGALIRASKNFTQVQTAIKLSFGEAGNTTHLDSSLFYNAHNILHDPVFIECNVLYQGKRTSKKDHILTAQNHGFGFLPIDILDGERGQKSTTLFSGEHPCHVGAGIEKYNQCVSIAHFKGHMAAGFGGALKNVGMGLGSRAGKLDMHSHARPDIQQDECTACGQCVKNCDVNAITINEKAAIDIKKCVGCAMCIAVCPVGAVKIPWGSRTAEQLMEKIAHYTKAITKGRKWSYINVLNNITYDCDCLGKEQKPFTKDIGILISDDPIAVDQASFHLVRKQCGHDPFLIHHRVHSEYILEYGERIGLGSRSYTLIKIK